MTIKRYEQLDEGGSMRNYKSATPGFTESLYSKQSTLKRLIGRSAVPEMIVKVVSDDELHVAYPNISQEGEKVFGISEPTKLVKEEINEHQLQGPISWWGERVHYIWQPTPRRLSLDQHRMLEAGEEHGLFTAEEAASMRDNLVYEAQQKDRSL